MNDEITITSVKVSGDGYMLNDAMFVPSDAGNRHYDAIQTWISQGNTPEAAFTLAEYKDKKKEAINSERGGKLNQLVVTLDGVDYDADEVAQGNVSRTITAINAGVIPVPDPMSWRAHDNTTQSLSHLKLLELAGLMFAAVDAIYNESWTMKASVDAAADEAAVDAVNWS